MGSFTKLLLGALLIALVGLPFFASWRGLGLPTERDASVMAVTPECPPGERLRDGRCRSYRSYYGGYIGGGVRRGK